MGDAGIIWSSVLKYGFADLIIFLNIQNAHGLAYVVQDNKTTSRKLKLYNEEESTYAIGAFSSA